MLRRLALLLAAVGLGAGILVRLVFFLAPPAHWLLGLSKVPFRTFVLGTAIGFLPGIVLLTILGGGLLEWMLGQPPEIGLLVVLAVGGVLVLRRWRERRRAEAPTESAAP